MSQLVRRCACGKRAFRFEARAKRYRLTVLRRHDGRKDPHTLAVYWCERSRAWHVGHSRILRRALKGDGE